MEFEKLHINDLPESIIDSVCDAISRYTVGLHRLTTTNKVEDLKLIGTGSLALVSGVHCIVTADHVLSELRKGGALCLLSSFSGELRRHRFEESSIQMLTVGRGSKDCEGPDIGVIVLPEAAIGTLKAEKVFFNIDKRSDRFRASPLPLDTGFWFNCGVIGETERTLPARPGFSSIMGYQGLCGVSVKPKEYERDGFDYLEVQVSYRSRHPDLPSSFGGYSGSGIWQVPLKRTRDGLLEAEDYLLSGVMFYQSALSNETRTLTGHGRKTIYALIPDCLNKELNRS